MFIRSAAFGLAKFSLAHGHGARGIVGRSWLRRPFAYDLKSRRPNKQVCAADGHEKLLNSRFAYVSVSGAPYEAQAIGLELGRGSI